MALDDLPAWHLVPADAAVVGPGVWEPGFGPPQRTPVLKEGVFLLDPNQGSWSAYFSASSADFRRVFVLCGVMSG